MERECDMKKIIFIILMLLMFMLNLSLCFAENEVLVDAGVTYICGDSFEVIFPDSPYMTHLISRQPPRKAAKVHITAGKDDILMVIRIKLRNLTPKTYQGLRTSSFKLIGYVRNHPHEYTADVWEPYDYGDYDSYYSYSKSYYKYEDLAPLHQIDMLLVFHVNPILRDWELLVEPKNRGEGALVYRDALYNEMNLKPCKAVFQFRSVFDAETGEITKYDR